MKLGRAEITSVVLAVLALSSVVAVLATERTPTTSERDLRAKNLFPVWREEELQKLELKAGTAGFTLERTPEGWNVRSPALEPADDAAVSKLIGGLGFATPVRRVERPELEEHGLAHPRATVTLAMGAQKLTLSLGDAATTPAGAAYVALDGAGSSRLGAVVPADVVKLFETRADELRRPSLLALGPREASEISIERPDGKLRLVRGGALAFRVDGGARANRDACEPLFRTLTALSATRFVSLEAAEKARGTAPLTRITLISREKTPVRHVIELGGACPGGGEDVLAIVSSPSVRAACVASSTLGPLSLEAAALRDPYPFAARKDEVESLALERGGHKLVLERRGTAFHLREPSPAEVGLEAGNRRLEAMLRAPAELVATPAPAALAAMGLSPARDHVTLTVVGDDDRGGEEKLDIGTPAADGTLHVRRVEDGAVLALGREAARAFLVDSTLLRSPKILDFALSALESLTLTAPEPQRLERTGSGFRLVTPAGFEPDGELATNAVLALGSLTALRWVADTDDGSFGLATPTLSARARFQAPDAGPSERVLVVGRAAPGGYFASLEGTPGVFLLDRASVERQGTLLINRSGFMADPSTLERLTLSYGGREVRFEKQAGVLAAKTPALSEETAATTLEALQSLVAVAAVHSGAARPNEGFAAPALAVRLEPGAGLGKLRSYRVGARSEYQGEAVRFARVDGLDATFVIAESKLQPLFDLF